MSTSEKSENPHGLCDRAGCGRTAKHSVRIGLRAPVAFEPCPAIVMSLGVVVCRVCKTLVYSEGVQPWLTPDARGRIADAIAQQGKVIPDFSRSFLELMPLGKVGGA